MPDISLEIVEFIKVLASSDSTTLEARTNDVTRHRLGKAGKILREYYLEKTSNGSTRWADKLLEFGIDEDTAKAAIACARRLGVNIS